MKKLIDPPQTMNAKDAAKYIGVARTTIYAWAATGKLPYVELFGGTRYYQAKDLDKAKQNSKVATVQTVVK